MYLLANSENGLFFFGTYMYYINHIYIYRIYIYIYMYSYILHRYSIPDLYGGICFSLSAQLQGWRPGRCQQTGSFHDSIDDGKLLLAFVAVQNVVKGKT